MKGWFKRAFIVAIAALSAPCVALLFAVVLQDVFRMDTAQVRLEARAVAFVTAGVLCGEMVLAKLR